ncbi:MULTISPECIES: AraC family transcriptional regulator [unclassified Rhizobium]|uniref:AraC family transcriptional regulator n=1 Tax=unclassified Rhizobium TaxID=2613769 RepID=UPI0018EA38F6
MADVSALEVKEKRATILGEAEAHLVASYCDHRLAPAYKNETVDFRHRHLQFGSSGFNFLQYGQEVSVSSRGFEEFYMLEMPLAGGVDIAFGTERLRSEPGKALILSPGPKFHSRWREGTRQWMLQIDRKLVDERLTQIARRRRSGDLVFNPVIDLATPHGRHFTFLLHIFSDMLAEAADPVEHETISPVLTSVVDELLRNIAFTSGASVVPERLQASPRHVKQAMDILKSRYAERLVMSAIANEIGISERALYDGFHTYYQRTPHEILTRIRMEEARRLIRNDGLAAAQAARSVGLHHLGRFSATYKDTFGVLPSADIRQDR